MNAYLGKDGFYCVAFKIMMDDYNAARECSKYASILDLDEDDYRRVYVQDKHT